MDVPAQFGAKAGATASGATDRHDLFAKHAEESMQDDFPVSHEVVLQDHTKAVSALAIEPSGARFATGGYDYDIRLWDWGGMTSTFKPFRKFEPIENGSYQIHDLAWDHVGENLLLIPGTAQPKLFSREGLAVAEFVKGDPYIRDMRNTAGHVAQLTSGEWSPTDRNRFITSSYDSTVRIWDVNKRDKSAQTIVLRSKQPGTRVKVTTAAYSKDGKMFAAAATDGSLNVFNIKVGFNVNYSKPNVCNETAHAKETETCSIAWSLDNYTIVTRGGDNTVKTWDMRKMKSALHVAENLPSLNSESNVAFSPDERYIIVGTAGAKAGVVPGKEVSVDPRVGGGKLVFLNRDDLTVAKQMSISQGSVIRVAWHERINQIFATTSLGAIHVLYNPKLSERGACLAVAKAPRTAAKDDYITDGQRPIYLPDGDKGDKIDFGTPSAGGAGGKRKREKERMDPVKSSRPEPPVEGIGKGGKVGSSANQHVVMGLVRDQIREVDPREALLKYANTSSDPTWTSAWTQNQPKPVFNERLLEDEAEEEERKRQKKANEKR